MIEPLRSLLILNTDGDSYAKAVRGKFPGLHVRPTTDRAEALKWLPEFEALAASALWVDDAMLRAGARLRWLHALTSGTDTVEASPMLRPELILTSSKGAQGPQMSELALMLMMALGRNLPAMLQNQRERRWIRWPQPLLLGRRVLLVGIGHISRLLAGKCKAMGMHVTGITSSPAPVEGFDAVLGRSQLAEAAAQADFVVVLAAHDAGTHHLVGAEVLRAMRPSACLINLARGGVIDEQALIEALRSHAIAGAALDVFNVEPLPQDS